MNLLAFDTSTDRLSIALSCTQDGEPRLWQHDGPGGAQASSTLIPAVERLMAEAGLRYAQLDAIAFGQGPGSFTGLRTACSVAQGLGFGAGVPLLPVDTLLAVAETARAEHAAVDASCRVLAVLDARMDEVYAAPYAYEGGTWTRQADYLLCRPEALLLDGSAVLAGNAFDAYGERLPSGVPRWPAWPSAAAMLRLVEHVRAQAGAVRMMLDQPLRSRIARMLAAHIAPALRARGVAAPRADVRALACAEGQLAALAAWMRGGAIAAPALAEELARLSLAAARLESP
jgi:tRNA threonylcarbamoyladenosine biosynthesis protein TsaB